ncbi:MAG: GNAT family N-acetyltransferase [Polyangiaceae bacterium]
MTPASDEGYTLRILDRVREVPEATWSSLLGPDSSPFVEHAWLDMLEETGCVGEGTAWRAGHLSLWRGERVVAVAPAYLKGNSEGEFVFDWSWADLAERIGVPYYPKVLVAVPFTPATGDRVLVAKGEDPRLMAQLLSRGAKQWCGHFLGGGVHVLFVRGEAEGAGWQDGGYLPRLGYQYHWFREGITSFEQYLGRFTSKQRNQIKRELRGVADQGITVETLPPQGHTREMARTMYGFYENNIERHGRWGRRYLTPAMFDAAVERFRDRLAWVVAKDRRGRVVAGAFNVAQGDRLYGRYWGASVDVPYLHFAVCYYEGIRYAIERGLDVFEPGAGGEHKRARGFVPTLTRSYHWLANARMRSVIGQHLDRERQAVTRLVESGGDEG